MPPNDTRPRPTRRGLRAGIGVAVLGTAALVGTAAALTSATDALLGASEGLAAESAAQAVDAPLLSDVQLAPPPVGCSAGALDERAGQQGLLAQQQAAERTAIDTVAGSRLATQLDGIQRQGRDILGRIREIDSGCAATPGG